MAADGRGRLLELALALRLVRDPDAPGLGSRPGQWRPQLAIAGLLWVVLLVELGTGVTLPWLLASLVLAVANTLGGTALLLHERARG